MIISTARKGFTLIELLIVIAIIAILATAVILLLNPAQLLAQARDSQRISDLDTMRTAISLYLATVTSTPAPGYMGSATLCYVNVNGLAANCDGRHNATRATTFLAGRLPDGTGWLPINFQNVPGGSPLSVLPKDPINNTTRFYSYATDGISLFELNANMESTRYAACGSDDAETTDGGDKGLTTDCPAGPSITTAVREVGNAPALTL